MTDQDYELLSQYLDEELAPAEAQSLRKRLIAEPALRAELEQMKRVTSRVCAALNTPAGAAVPAHVAQLVEESSAARTGDSAARRTGWGLAIAASVLAASGLLLSPQWQQTTDQDVLMAQVLENNPSSGDRWELLADGKRLRPVLSFRSTAGNWCREYLLEQAGNNWRGVACRDDNGWRTEVISAVAAASSASEYQPAGSADSDQIANFISDHAADIPLSGKQEARLIDAEDRKSVV